MLKWIDHLSQVTQCTGACGCPHTFKRLAQAPSWLLTKFDNALGLTFCCCGSKHGSVHQLVCSSNLINRAGAIHKDLSQACALHVLLMAGDGQLEMQDAKQDSHTSPCLHGSCSYLDQGSGAGILILHRQKPVLSIFESDHYQAEELLPPMSMMLHSPALALHHGIFLQVTLTSICSSKASTESLLKRTVSGFKQTPNLIQR